MTVVALLLLLILAPVGICAVVCCVGWWATVSARLTHEERMFVAGEQAKLNAVEVQARQLEALDRVSNQAREVT